jgi:hypothetical protein
MRKQLNVFYAFFFLAVEIASPQEELKKML